MDARICLASLWLVCLGSGPGLAGRLERLLGPVARVRFLLQPQAPHTAQVGHVHTRGRNLGRR
jgi:hypothetical protein